MAGGHRDNAKVVIAEIARASGLTFARPDRLSRDEAEAVIRWAQGNAEFMAAYSDRSHPYHAEAVSYSEWPFFFKHTFPQTEDGQPVEWDQVRTADQDAEAAEPEVEAGDFDQLTPEQARERIEAAGRDAKYAEWRAAYFDPKHPDHALAQREYTRLNEIAYPEPQQEPAPAAAASGTAVPTGDGPAVGLVPAAAPMGQDAALRRIDELYRDSQFMKRYQSPQRDEREAATAEMLAAFAAAYPDTAPAPEGEA